MIEPDNILITNPTDTFSTSIEEKDILRSLPQTFRTFENLTKPEGPLFH